MVVIVVVVVVVVDVGVQTEDIVRVSVVDVLRMVVVVDVVVVIVTRSSSESSSLVFSMLEVMLLLLRGITLMSGEAGGWFSVLIGVSIFKIRFWFLVVVLFVFIFPLLVLSFDPSG